MSLFDFVYDWLIHVVPNWIWWILITPLFILVAFIIAVHFWPALI